ncbi:stage II sporulation protein P [Clostridium ihumii]|uniref:stage II sporulation protein P n=1 Tax=Clostridium ihumii TaxID=1470356 RepID=UPI000684D89F|nr:stage II sporulation protein P [Clostridium ihumii]
MNYKKQSYKKNNFKYNPKYNIKYLDDKNRNINLNKSKSLKTILIITSLILCFVFSAFNIYFLNKSEIKTNILYKAMNNSMATLGVSSKKLDTNEKGTFLPNNIKKALKYDIEHIKNSKSKEKSSIRKNDITMDDVYNIEAFNLSENDIKKNEIGKVSSDDLAKNAAKKILIYHTHTCEAYSPGENRKQDLSLTIAGVGEELTKSLKEKGFTVIHDMTLHDNVDYPNAYKHSRETLKRYLNEFKDFDLIIDLHRDGGVPKARVTSKINEESIAKIMFATTSENPRYKKQLEKINKIAGISKKIYPELFRDIVAHDNGIGCDFYSHDLSDNAVLIEVGSEENTLDEAKNSMKYLAEAIRLSLN